MGERFDKADVHAAITALADVSNFSSTADMRAAIAADGHTYDRSAIERWLLHHSSSPKVRENKASVSFLKQCFILRLYI